MVDAAINGHLLVIEGLEKAERNVLPILNNLLENREMALEDGRFLMESKKFEKLFQDLGESEDFVSRSSIVKVSDKFQVVAIGIPVPPFPGNPLDPPLRSRFQSARVPSVPIHSLLRIIQQFYSRSVDPPSQVLELLSFVEALRGTVSESAKKSGIQQTLLAFHHLPQLSEMATISACAL